MSGEVSVHDLDLISVMNLSQRKKKKYIAIMMNEIEELILPKSDPKFIELRKILLDNVNELERAWLRIIFPGDVEGTGIF